MQIHFGVSTNCELQIRVVLFVQKQRDTYVDPHAEFFKITGGWKKIRLIFGLAELSR